MRNGRSTRPWAHGSRMQLVGVLHESPSTSCWGRQGLVYDRVIQGPVRQLPGPHAAHWKSCKALSYDCVGTTVDRVACKHCHGSVAAATARRLIAALACGVAGLARPPSLRTRLPTHEDALNCNCCWDTVTCFMRPCMTTTCQTRGSLAPHARSPTRLAAASCKYTPFPARPLLRQAAGAYLRSCNA
jgi:hypothetical protein